MSREKNIGGSVKGTEPNGNPGEQFTNENGGTGSDTGNPVTVAGGSELLTNSSVGSGDSTASNGGTAAAKKRGRPPGSKNANAGGAVSRGVAASKSELRKQLGDGLTLATQLGFTAIGYVRAEKYKASSVELANQIWTCWQIPAPAAASVGVPAANCLAEYLPDKVLGQIAASIDPVAALGAAYMIFDQCRKNEEHVVTAYMSKFVTHPAAEPTEPIAETKVPTVEEAYGPPQMSGIPTD